MEYDPSDFNNALAKYYCSIIHGVLVGKVPNKPNAHLTYSEIIMSFINSIKNPSFFIKNIKKVIKIYSKITGLVVSKDIFIDGFVENYSYKKVHEKLSGTEKLSHMSIIIYKALVSYNKYINKRDPKSFFNVEMDENLKNELCSRLATKIHHQGVEMKYLIYCKNNDKVPKKLFVKLRKHNAKLIEKVRILEEQLN